MLHIIRCFKPLCCPIGQGLQHFHKSLFEFDLGDMFAHDQSNRSIVTGRNIEGKTRRITGCFTRVAYDVEVRLVAMAISAAG